MTGNAEAPVCDQAADAGSMFEWPEETAWGYCPNIMHTRRQDLWQMRLVVADEICSERMYVSPCTYMLARSHFGLK